MFIIRYYTVVAKNAAASNVVLKEEVLRVRSS